MTQRPEQAKIDKLPKWAQEYIADIERERNAAVRTLNEFKDADTPSPFSYEETPCIGERPGPSFVKRFVQTYYIIVEHAGVRVRVTTNEEDCIGISYEDSERMGRQISLVPVGYQHLELIAKEKMR